MTESVSRYEDMSRLGQLQIMQQEDGDMIVAIALDQTTSRGYPSVEFCASGGQSPRTRAALRALMQAMQQDEAESPQRR